jgi:hypothetical protein
MHSLRDPDPQSGEGGSRRIGVIVPIATSDRHSPVRTIARDLRIDLEEAQRWCEAWERFAKRQGVVRGPYYWDSARGWIDAQRSFERADRSSPRRRAG